MEQYEVSKYCPIPTDENCYEYLQECYRDISKDVGEYGAFVNIDCEFTMTELFEDVEKLAAFLVSQGIGKGDVVTAFIPTSPFAFTLFYAVNKIGAITSFVHPLLPKKHLRIVLELTKSKMVFVLDRAVGAFADVLSDYTTVVCGMHTYTKGKVYDFVLADDKANSAIPETDNIILYDDIVNKDWEKVPTIEHNGFEPAIYLHGSGTTGKSKTVIISSSALNHSTHGQIFCGDFDLTDLGNSYSLCCLPCFHCFGIATSIHHCICVGHTPIIMPKFDAEKANYYISKYNVQYISGAPRMFEKMMEAPNFENDGLKNLAFVYSGGDIVTEDLVTRFNDVMIAHGAKARMQRGWGLTEAAGATTTNTMHGSKEGSIGYCIGLDKVKILDENGKEVPNGTMGEIAITGKTIMIGYLLDDDVTHDGVHYDEDGTPWIYSGDMGYVDDDGFLYFSGRIKRIIIISGYNVYPYDIEQALSRFEYINEACAVQGYSDSGKPLIKLCLSLNETTLTQDEIKEEVVTFIKENFDQFSVPRKVVFMDALPRTKMDKLDFMAMSDKLN